MLYRQFTGWTRLFVIICCVFRKRLSGGESHVFFNVDFEARVRAVFLGGGLPLLHSRFQVGRI